jgi:hypothetical protein
MAGNLWRLIECTQLWLIYLTTTMESKLSTIFPGATQKIQKSIELRATRAWVYTWKQTSSIFYRSMANIKRNCTKRAACEELVSYCSLYANCVTCHKRSHHVSKDSVSSVMKSQMRSTVETKMISRKFASFALYPPSTVVKPNWHNSQHA